MNPEPCFLSENQIMAIHRNVVRAFGGDASVRDRRLLASAVAMPSATFEGRFLHSDLSAMAAAYLFHLCRNHPFVDGNKRTALASAEVFLIVNGSRLEASDQILEDLTIQVAAGSLSKDEATVFFRAHVKRLSQS